MEWISVKDRLPDYDTECLVGCKDAKTIIADLTAMTSTKTGLPIWQTAEGYFKHHITHWMPLPEPPKE